MEKGAWVVKIQGIYEIVCFLTGKRYLGSSCDIFARWCNHRLDLNRQQHHSVLLQRAWNKYGAEAFEFRILELVIDGDLLTVEQNWLNSSVNSLNIASDARSPVLGRHLPASTREKISAANRGQKRSKESCANISRALIGKPKSEAHRRNLSRAKKGRPFPLSVLEAALRHNRGRKLSPEHVAKVAAANTGKKRSPEYVEKHRARLVAMAEFQRGKPKPRKVRLEG